MNTKEQLFKLAAKAYHNAYAPYSNFSVGAAIFSAEGNFFAGANVENISYPCGNCAEQSAISAMIASGDKKIAEILIIADTKQPITPCGACLQRIKEFSDSNTLVHLANLKEITATYKLDQLLPIAFASEEVVKCTKK